MGWTLLVGDVLSFITCGSALIFVNLFFVICFIYLSNDFTVQHEGTDDIEDEESPDEVYEDEKLIDDVSLS